MKLEINDNGKEVCSQCKKEFHSAKYLDKEKKIWVCMKCYFEEEE